MRDVATSHSRALHARAGFTLAELLVSLVLFSIIVGVAVSFFTMQVRTFELGAERTAATQRAQQAIAQLSRDVRTAGTNTTGQQPWLVYAGETVIAFHADHTARVQDPFAVYVDDAAPAGQVSTLPASAGFVLPNTTFHYPDSTYWLSAGVRSSAELLLFYFLPDTLTARPDDFILYRQVNDAEPEEVARHLLRADTTPFFQYYRLGTATDGNPAHLLLPRSQLPLRHTIPLHNSPRDTGVVARIDSVRAVRITVRGTNGMTGAGERTLTRTQYVWLRNGNLAEQRSCGSQPLFGSVVNAVRITIDDAPAVRITWNAAIDENGGERDVIRYVLWRRAPGDPIGEPFLSFPAGSASYQYVDRDVAVGDSWVYAVAAQDCTPSMSGPIATGTVIITGT